MPGFVIPAVVNNKQAQQNVKYFMHSFSSKAEIYVVSD